MESTRQQKVARLIQKELSNIFIREGSLIYGRNMVSVTVVRMSPDLSVAKIYLSIFITGENADKKKKEVIKSLDEHKSKLRFLLGQSMKGQMRVVPELIFYVDDSVDYYQKIDNILKKVNPEGKLPESDQEQ